MRRRKLYVQADQIAKTLAFSFEDRSFVVVTSGMTRIFNQKFKKVFNQRPRMLPHDQVETMTGYRIGGVCPFALNDGVKVYLDYSLKNMIYFTRPPAISMLLSVYLWTSWKNILEQLAGLMLKKK
ncbi:YbaK/EbsC family protein [Oenococcus oeni]